MAVVLAAVAGLLPSVRAQEAPATRRPATRPATAPAKPHWDNAPPGARHTKDGWFAPMERKSPPPALPKTITKAFVIPIHGPIEEITQKIVERKVMQCRAQGAELVIFDMDTPGGRTDVMQAIVDLIMDDLSDAYTVAYVNPNAFSAGAIISLACNEIVLAPRAKIGAAMSIMIGPGGVVELPERVRGKFDSADRTGMRTLARHRGYSPVLCEAMVSLDLVVWLVRNTKTRELRFVNGDTWRGVKGAPTTRPVTGDAAAKRKGWQFVRQIDGPKELISMTAGEAVFLGFSEHILDSMSTLEQHYTITVKPTVLGETWSEKLVAVLNSPLVSTILLVLGLMAMYSETRTPGLGFPAAIAVACFAVVFGGKYLTGLAQWWEIALFVVGLGLIAVEVFVIPGFGVAGIAGILCCVGAFLAMLIPNAPTEIPWPKTDLAWDWFYSGLLWSAIAFVCAAIGSAVISRYLPAMPVARAMFLGPAEHVEEPPVPESAPIRRVQVGDVGVVEAVCRPIGKVRIGDDILDGTAEGELIEQGAKVRVLHVDGNRVVIERA